MIPGGPLILWPRRIIQRPVLNGLTTDQRKAGFPRINGSAVDIGAYESDPASTRGCTLDLDGNNILDACPTGWS